MTEPKYLYSTINTQKEALKNFNPEIFDIPKYISENLKYDFFDWQKEALENLLFYENEKSNLKKVPTHLMFNMATGTGKTLLMASMLLYYYKQGYRHFIFFVNQSNIVDKTENNFIDNTHTKYLFKDTISIDDKVINIKKVETFSDNTNNIEIKFTTVHKLYNDIHIEKENQTTLEDLHQKDIVMLADEAHHLNASTKKKQGEQEELDLKTELKETDKDLERKGWEHTVNKIILNKNKQNTNNRNVLLEFTATIPENEEVAKKYEDKIIYRFGLKEFLAAGYTKEINLISSTLDKKERILQALLFQWYRHKIALKYNITNFKPVILFRSKTIVDSENDYADFLQLLHNLSTSDFSFCKTIANKIFENKKPALFEMGKSRTEQVLDFIKQENINYSEIAEFIKYNFKEKNCIITNSKDKSAKGVRGGEKTTEGQERLLNSLEDKNNHIRAIFTVDRLTEGWDVLNLFDIVRLYQGQNTGGSTTKTPEATTKEKQLIGRGVRYFPFTYNNKQKNKRKFDDDIKHELRVLEELYYYTYDEESRYISHLKDELRKDGYIRDNKILKTFKLKEAFKESDFYNDVHIWYNEQTDNPQRRKKSLEELKEAIRIKHATKTFEEKEEQFGVEKEQDTEKLNIKAEDKWTISPPPYLKEFEKNIFYKALNIKANQGSAIFQFRKLKEDLHIESMEDLLNDEFLGNFNAFEIITKKNTDFSMLSNKEKLTILLKFLDTFERELKERINPKVGTEFKTGAFSKFFSGEKIKSIEINSDTERIEKELKEKDWYILDSFHGTSEEKELIQFIQDTIGNLENKYEQTYLLRNEEVYKIYDFKTGRGFQPDFILFLKGKESTYYQVFIEPKGDNLVEHDDWKNMFLLKITEKYGSGNILQAENKQYSLIGLPLFNSNDSDSFNKEYKKLCSTIA